MKKKFTFLVWLLSLCMAAGFVGCSAGASAVNDPIDAIKQQYGTREFTVSFSSENLSEPLADIAYTAYDMPKLPTPERVGYIFEGWYFDKSYTTPYTDGALYLYMSDVTLYAKWSKEEFVNDGTYDIEISAEIVEGSLKLGSLSEAYGWKNLTEDIVIDETYIEKTENGLQLKLTYDNGATAPFGSIAAYKILPSVSMGSSVYLAESIVPDNETVHSLFYNIDNFDITNPIYLDVTATNWETGLSSTEAAETRAAYTVKLTIKRLIGFSQGYVDPDVEAEPGYYLVKTHFTKEDGTTSMMESYNSVYAYVQVDAEGNYTLIKPFMPYAGMVATVNNDTLSHYYSRDMTFAPTQLYYTVTVPESDGETISADYFAEYYNGEKYGVYSVEFHADTGRYYQIFDLGGSFKRQFMIRGATTGFMEQAFAMGAYNSVMSIDYEHIVKISEIDYTPLSGEHYCYGDSVQYYAGKLADLNAQNVAKSAVEQGGVADSMINLFYSAVAADAPTSARTMHSFRMTVTPTTATNTDTVKDSRYKVANFNVRYSVYGYEPQDGKNLYADSMTTTSFGSDGVARRENIQILCGKGINVGDVIWLRELYKEKTNGEYAENTVTIYPLKQDGSPDYARGTETGVNAPYMFRENVAVEFRSGQSVSLIYLKEYSAPEVEVVNTAANTYTEYGHTVGDTVLYPIVRYTYMGNSGGFIDTYYPSLDDTMVVDPTRVALYAVDGENYTLSYLTGTLDFQMRTNHMVVAYECRNEFGEIYFYYLHFYAESQTKYTLTEDGNVVSSGTVRYDANTGERQPVQITSRNGNIASDLDEIAGKEYKIVYGASEILLPLAKAELYANGAYSEYTEDILENVAAGIVGADYYIVKFTYASGSDYYSLFYEYNLRFDGKSQLAFVTDTDTFTEYEYLLKCPDTVASDGTVLGSGSIAIRKYSGGSYYSATASSVIVEQYGNTYSVTFKSTGKYRFVYSVQIAYDEYGNRLFGGDGVALEFYQDIEVIDGKGDVTITYVTDKAHPFAEGIPYVETDAGYAYTVTYNLTQSILTLAQQNGTQYNFTAVGTDRLFGWLKREDYTLVEASKALRRGYLISDFIGTFGSSNVTLYALWDQGMDVIVDRAEDITGLTPQTVTKWLSTDSYYYGKYLFSLNTLEFTAPSGYVHKGWTVNGTFYAAGTSLSLQFGDNAPVEVKVVLAKQYTVRYIVNTLYGNRIADGAVEEGEAIGLPQMTEKDGYTFAGWKLVTAYMNNSDYTVGSEMIDETTAIGDGQALCQVNGKQAVILVAVFEDAEGNEIC